MQAYPNLTKSDINKWCMGVLFFQFNAEDGAASNFRPFHKDAAMMVFLNDTFGKRQPQSPTSFFCRKAWTEDIGYVFLPDSFSRIFHFHKYFFAGFANAKRDGPCLTTHCIDCILAQVLYHPLEKGGIEAYYDTWGFPLTDNPDIMRCTPIHVDHHMRYHCTQTGRHKFRQ